MSRHFWRSLSRLWWVVVLTATLGAIGLAPAAVAAPGTTPVSPPVAVSTQGSLRLTAQPLQSSYAPGELAVIEVTATNTGDQTLSYWLPTPCDTPFRVTITLTAGTSVRLPRESEMGKPPTMCIQVVQPLRLGPGASVTERFGWDTGAAQAVEGTYTVTVAFNAQSETDAPNTAVSVPLVIGHLNADLTDIQNHWAAADIVKAVQAGFVNGYPDRRFLPDQTVTRAELLKMLVLARHIAPVTGVAPSFTDVASHWVETQGYLEAAVAAGFLHPADYQNALNPDQPLSREETAVLIVRAMGLEQQAQSADPAALAFADKADIAAGDAGFILTATSKGIIKGYEDFTFRPDRPVTRAEAVTMLLRMQNAL